VKDKEMTFQRGPGGKITGGLYMTTLLAVGEKSIRDSKESVAVG